MARNQKKKSGNALRGIAGMLGMTGALAGIGKGIKAIRKGVTKRRRMKFGDAGTGRGKQARAFRRKMRGTTGSWFHRKKKKK